MLGFLVIVPFFDVVGDENVEHKGKDNKQRWAHLRAKVGSGCIRMGG